MVGQFGCLWGCVIVCPSLICASLMAKTPVNSKNSKSKPKLVAGYIHGRVPRAVREQQILDIAEQQFLEKGYEGTSVESVRIEAGVSRPIIYDHYGSKDKLYLACVKRAREDFQRQLESVWKEPGTHEEMLKRGSELYFRIVEENPRRWLVLFSGSVVPSYGELADEFATLRQGTIDLISSLIKTRAPNTNEEEAEAYAQAVFCVGDHLARWWQSHPEIPRERMQRYHTNFIFNGLAQLDSD